METRNIIRERREALRLTLEDVAQRVHVNRSTVQRWETGSIQNLGHDKIAKLAAALQVSPEYLLGWTEDPELLIEDELAIAIADLTDDETAQVLNYIAFLKSQRRNSK